MEENNNVFISDDAAPQNAQPQTVYVDTSSYRPFYAPHYTDPKLLLKKDLRSTANKAGAGLLMFYGFMLVYQIVISIIAVSFANKGQQAYQGFVDFISDPTFTLLFNSFYQCIFMTLPFVAAALISKVNPSDILNYSKPKKSSVIPFAVLGLGGAMLCNLANSIIYALFSLFGSSPKGGNIDMDMGIESLFLNLLTVAVIPALFEEFAFRGVFMGLLKRKFSTPAAIIISAAAFGLIHGNFAQMPFAFLMGVVFGYLYAASGSIWVPMLVHFLNNSYSVLLDHLTYAMNSILKNTVFYATLVVFLLAGIMAFIYIVKKKPELFEIQNEEKEIPTSKMLKIGFSSPTIIISAILFCIDAIVIQLGGVA